MPISELELNKVLRVAKENPDDLELQEAAITYYDTYEREKPQRINKTLGFFRDRETHGLTGETLNEINRIQKHDPMARYRLLNDRYLKEVVGVDEKLLRNAGTSTRAAYSEKVWGTKITDEGQFFQRIADDVDTGDALEKYGRAAGLRGVPPVQAMAELPEDIANSEVFRAKEFEFRQQYERAVRQGSEMIGPHVDLARKFAADLKTSMGIETEGGEKRDDSDFVNTVLDLPKDRRAAFIASVVEIAGEGEDKNIFQKMAERVGRSTGMISNGATDFFAQKLEGIHALERAIIRNGSIELPEELGFDTHAALQGSVKHRKDFINSLDSEDGLFTTAIPEEGSEEWNALPDDVQANLEQLSRERDAVMLQHELEQLATGVIDPSQGDWWLDKGLLGVSSSVPIMVAMATPLAGQLAVTSAYRNNEKMDLLQANPGMSLSDADTIAGFSSVLMTMTEKFELGVFKGKLPLLNGWLNKATLTTKSFVSRMGVRAVGGAAIEIPQEFVQEVSTPLFQELLSALSSDVPSVDWDGVLTPFFSDENMSELIPTVVMISLFGAGVGALRDHKNGRGLVADADALRLVGISEAKANEIRTLAKAEKWDEAQALLREEFKQSGRDQQSMAETRAEIAEKVVKQKQERMETIQKAETLDLLPSIRRTAEGYSLQFKDGTARGFETHGEAMDAAFQAASDSSLRLHEETRSIMRKSTSRMETGREFDFIFETRELNEAQAIEEGLSTKEGLEDRRKQGEVLDDQEFEKEGAQKEDDFRAPTEESIEQEYDEAFTAAELHALEEGDKDVISIILGTNSTFGEEIQKTTIRLFNGYTPYTVLEEKVEGDVSAMLKKGKRDWLIKSLREVEGQLNTGKHASRLFIEGRADEDLTPNDIREAFSHLAMSYFAGRSRRGESDMQSQEFRDWAAKVMRGNLGVAMESYGRFFKAVWKRAAKLNKLRREGKLDADLEKALARSVGFGEQQEYDSSVKKARQDFLDELDEGGGFEMEPETASTFVPTDDAPFSIIEKGPGFEAFSMPDGRKLEGPASFSIMAFHGTPHKVDKFSLGKIGTGEGAQAYGWGLYFAEDFKVAKSYRDGLAGKRWRNENGFLADQVGPVARKFIREAEALGYDARQSLKDAAEGAAYFVSRGENVESNQSVVDAANEALPLFESAEITETGAVYTVELDANQDDFLDWDKPLSEQSEKVQRALTGLSEDYSENSDEYDAAELGQTIYSRVRSMLVQGQLNIDVFDSRYKEDAKDENERLADVLNVEGIKGIRYLDGNSRADGEGSYNYVIFDESLVKILKENGEPLQDERAEMQPSFSMISKSGEFDDSYRIQHQPSSEDARLDSLAELMGEDIYGPNALQYYGAGQDGEAEAVEIFKRVKGNPEASVEIYRVVPDFVEEINPGDWVTISKTAADAMNDPTFVGVDNQGNEQGAKIISKEVKAKEIVWPGDSLLEQGYAPEGYSFSMISKQVDSDYLAAVEAGDMEAAQRMVDEAARRAGVGSPRAVDDKDILDRDLFWRLDSARQELNPAFKSTSQNDDIIEDGLSTWPTLERLLHNIAYGDADYSMGSVDIVAIHGEEVGVGQDGEPVIIPNSEAARFRHENLAVYGDTPVSDMADAAEDGLTIPDFLRFGWSRVAEMQMRFDPVTYDSDGNVIPLSKRFDSSRDEISFSMISVSKHLRDDPRFETLKADGRIETGVDIGRFIGDNIILHAPDNAFAGEIDFGDGNVVEGKGGVYYPLVFADDNYFWASTRNAAMGMAKLLNENSAKNGGRIRMGLVSSPVEKLFSSSTLSIGTVTFFEALAKNPRKSGVTRTKLNAMIARASRAEAVVNGKAKGFSARLRVGDGLDANLVNIRKLLDPDKSIFAVRKAFVESLASQLAEETKGNDNHASYIAETLTREGNRFAKGAIKSGKLSKAAILQGLGDLFTEPFLKDFQEHGNGKVYAIIEVDGEVEAIPSDRHESYPFAISPKDKGNKVKVNVLREAFDWQTVVGKEGGEKTLPSERKKLFPTSGISGAGLEVLPLPKDSPGAPLSFSILKNADTRIASAFSPVKPKPEAKRKIVQEVQRRVAEAERKWQTILNANRSNKEIEAERKNREADLMADKLDTLSPSMVAALEVSNDLDDEAQRPLLSRLLTRKTYTRKDGKVVGYWGGSIKAKSKASDNSLAEYDDMPDGLPSYVFGGDMSPDQAAAENGFDSVADFWTALEREIESFRSVKEQSAEATAQLRELEKEARDESREWAAEQRKLRRGVGSDRQTLIGAMRTLDAMISALPPEVRGKIGGYTRLAQFKGPVPMMEHLEKKAEKVKQVLETWLVKEQRKRVDKALEKAKVKKTAKGIPKSDLPADTLSELQAIKEYADLSKLEYDEQLSELSERLAESGSAADTERITDDMVRLVSFGHIDGMDSAQLESVADNLETLIKTGKTIKQVMDEERAAEVQRIVDFVNEDVTGGKGEMLSNEAKKRARKRKGLGGIKGGIAGQHRRNLSWEWILNGLARENTEVGTLQGKSTKELSEMVHVATHKEKRANLKSAREFKDFLSEVFQAKGVKLSRKLEKLSEEIEKTGVFRIDYGRKGKTTKKEIRATVVESVLVGGVDPGSLGFDAKEWNLIKLAYQERSQKQKGKKLSLPDNAIIRYEVENQGRKEELDLSQDQAINLTMLYRQEELRESMQEEGYSDETMEQMEAFLSPQAKEIREWLAEFYDRNHGELNKVFKVENGANLPKIENYSPAVRMAQGTEKEMEINGQGGSAMTTTPSFFISRVKNFAQMDQRIGAMEIYSRHSMQSNHYIAWAKPVKILRGVFGNADVKGNIKAYRGDDHLKLVNERIEWFADGGNRAAGHYAFLSSLRNTFTLSALSWNIFTSLKQLTSLPAYMFDMSAADFATYSAKFAADIPGNIKSMLETEYVKARLEEGYERDVISALKGDGGYIRAGLQMGMLPTKVGDIIPVVAGGWMARQRAYDLAKRDGMTDEQAEYRGMLAFEMATDRAQQAGDLKDLSHYQGGGSLFKLFTMFKTSPRQYYANVYESLLDAKAGKKGAKSEFVRRMIIGQVILPMVFQAASDVLRSPFNDDDEEDFEAPDYVRAVLLGPLNGLFIAGDMAELLTSGLSDTKIWFEELPIFSGPTEVAGALQEFWDGDFQQGLDELLRGMGRMVAPFTYYEIFRRETDRLGITE